MLKNPIKDQFWLLCTLKHLLMVVSFFLLYVDDMIITCEDIEAKYLKSPSSLEFEMDFGNAIKILRMEIYKKRKEGFLQRLKKILEKFGMYSANLGGTPLVAYFRLSFPEEIYMSALLYSSATGSLIYAIVCRRLDITHSTSFICWLMATFEKSHWQVVKWVLRYLKGI